MMEWYWVVAIIAAFLAVVALLVWLGKTGKLQKKDYEILTYVVKTFDDILDYMQGVSGSQSLHLFATISEIVKQAVYAAENAWYNGEIDKNDRYARCIENIDAMLLAAGIELDPAQHEIIEVLIKAACEELGHGAVEAMEAATVFDKE